MKKILEEIKNIKHRNDVPSFLENNNHSIIGEIGVRKGDYFKRLMSCKPKKIVGIDLWKDDGVLGHNDQSISQSRLDTWYKYWDNYSRDFHEFDIDILRMHSHDAAMTFDYNYFDFLFLDADHTYEAVKQDLFCWWPKVKEGGVLSGHDYTFRYRTKTGVVFGVVEAVHEFIGKYDLQPYFHSTPDSTWFIYKKG